MKIVLKTPPASLPVTAAEFKLHARIDDDVEDSWIATALQAATDYCEQMCGRAFVQRTYTGYLDGFPSTSEQDGPAIVCNQPRLISVASLKYVDEAGVLQTLDSSKYFVDAVSEPGKIHPAYGLSWPSTRNQPNSVQVEFDAGYGAAASVDARAKQAVLFLTGHWYQNRETVTVGSITKEIEHSLTALTFQIWHGRL